MLDFNKLEVPFYLVAYPRSLIKNDGILFKKLAKAIHNLSLIYNVIIYDDPLLLTEEEGIEFTQRALENKKNLRGIIFALDEQICMDEDISLRLCLEFCHNKDITFSKKSKNHLYIYGAGFKRLLISLSDNPAQVISNLNEKYPTFYDPNSICFSFNRYFSEYDMSRKLFLSILSFEKYRVNLFALKQNEYTNVKEYRLKNEKKYISQLDKALKRQKNNYMVIFYVDEIKESYIEYLNDKVSNIKLFEERLFTLFGSINIL